MSSINETPKPRTSPLEFRNTDLVSRLLAATPPYLYNMSLVPHTYFFSEMLRSLVASKDQKQKDQNLQIHHQRKNRKRSWNYITPPQTELSSTSTELPPPPPPPPPPPVWYPPPVWDPLHFFIDLRVSGHIYDRKTEEETGKESTVVTHQPNQQHSPPKRRPSAFTVPSGGAVNLSRTMTKFDVKSIMDNKISTNYIMQNIDGIYKNIRREDEENKDNDKEEKEVNVVEDEDEESEEAKKEKKDLRALIGLELVVDYMSAKKQKEEESVINSNEVELEVVAE